MANIVFLLCAITSIASAVALFRGYKKSANRLLLWGGFSFLFLALNNVFLCADMIFFPDIDMHGSFIRNLLCSISGGLLLGGLIWEIA